MSDYPALPPDDQDRALNHTGEESIYQRIRTLTNDERAILDRLFATGDIRELLTATGKPRTSAAREIARKIPDLMDRLGLTDERLLQKGIALLDAKETKFFQKDGIVTDERDVEALGIQKGVWEFLCAMRNMKPAPDAMQRDYESNITVNIVHVGG